MRRAILLVSFVLLFPACGKQRVVTQPDSPPLAPPPPPARVVAPPEPEEQPPAPAPEPDRKAPRRSVPKTSEPPPATPPKPEPIKPVAPVPETQPPSTLQTATPAAQADMERQARGLITQAKRDLDQVKRPSLNQDGKGQYDAARRFVEQADQALKEQNWVLAKSLADKAATIAAVLVGK